jgi:tetratricopeptide (TPR) repeat protein
MSDTDNSPPLDTTARDVCCEHFESAWRAWHDGEEAPRWQAFLPALGEPCDAELIFFLVALDVECRAKARLPALLTERYIEHPRLQHDDARLDAGQQVELIRWEYEQRWKYGQRARRGDYQAAFPQHADALRDLKPRSCCPQCGQPIALEESAQTLRCPQCATDSPVTWASPPFVAAIPPSPNGPSGLDLRDYPLIEPPIGVGGMGGVYRASDPALGRDLAVKVMSADLHGHPSAERRFLREARVTGSLQHPGIVAVYNLGQLPDGRLHYTMRLVKGETFADILKEKAGRPEGWPELLRIFEKVCQAVAYAHSKRVIHRDLKPANVMVGKFGEVQVMDWGLAKLLTEDDIPAEPEGTPEREGTQIQTESADRSVNLTRAGREMGTPAYMPPEQALGEWDAVNERADVFALGAILCEILTGKPPYGGSNWQETLRRAKRGDLSEGLGQLERRGAEVTLTALCRECLASAREDRPRNAGVVAKRVGEYQAEVQERLRRAELERVAAEARTAEEQARTREALARVAAERRARQRLLALAAAVLLLVGGGVAGFWWQRWKQERADQAVINGLAQVELLEQQARADHLQTDKYHLALEASHAAAKLAEGASYPLRQSAEELVTRLSQEEIDAKKDQKLLSSLLEVRGPREGPKHAREQNGMMIALGEPTAEELYAAAFRAWGLEVDTTPVADAVTQIKKRPQVVVTEIIAALDEWASERQRQSKSKGEWQHLAALASGLEGEPDAKRRELREILARNRLPVQRALAVLSIALRPVPLPMEVPLGDDRIRIRQLAERIDPATESVLSLIMLTRALRVSGEDALAERLLRAAIGARPREVVLNHSLALLLVAQEPPRWKESVEFFRVVRTLRPDLGVNLAKALIHSGRDREGLALLARLVKENSDNPFLHIQHGIALGEQGKLTEAEIACRKAIELQSDYPEAYYTLGVALSNQGKLAEAMVAYRKAIELKPDFAAAYSVLGVDLLHSRKLDEAEAACRKAIDIQPDLAIAYVNLGAVLADQRKLAAAVAVYRTAIELSPDLAEAYSNLGDTLREQGKLAEAVTAHRRAITLRPDLGGAYYNLGLALADQRKLDEAVATFRKAVELKPDLVKAYFNLGNALVLQKKLDEAATVYRKATELRSDYAKAYFNLGTVLAQQGKLDEAVVALRKAIELQPDFADAYGNLANALHEQGKLAEAVAACSKAIELQPDFALAYNTLGGSLAQQGKLEEAVVACRKAIELKPDFAVAYNTLGGSLAQQGKLEEAVVACRKAIELQPNLAVAYRNLALALIQQAQFTQALAALEKGIARLPANEPNRKQLQQIAQACQRLIMLDAQLTAVLGGTAEPNNAAQQIEFATLCALKKLHSAAARFYADAFSAEPKLAADLNQQHRYNAACSAALAANGRGKDARMLPDKVVGMFRRWAFRWLRDDLKDYSRDAKQKPQLKQVIQQRLAHWRTDSDLASVREPQALDRLHEDERAEWQALWRDVDELAKRVATNAKP